MLLLEVLFFCGVVLAVYAKPNIESRIVGGTNANSGEIPYQASLCSIAPLGMGTPSHFCGGSIIGADWVISAAHCLCNEALETLVSQITGVSFRCTPLSSLQASLNIRVYINTIYLSSGGSQYGVKKVIQHPQYVANTLLNDVGLLQLKTPITAPVPLIALAGVEPADGDSMIVSGWGLLIDGGSTLSDRLQKLSVIRLNTDQCEAALASSGGSVSDGNICTENKEGQGPCNGDSGGPLTFEDILVGIVSWGIKCADGNPNVFTRVAKHCGFIQDNTGISCNA